MKYLFTCLFLGCLALTYGQRKFSMGNKKSDFFGNGAQDNRALSNTGLQIGIGPTYMFEKDSTFFEGPGGRNRYVFTPSGKLGIGIDIGTATFNMKPPRFKFGKIVKYIDWGIGFNLYGVEETTSKITDLSRAIIGSGSTYLGNIAARGTLHHQLYIPKTSIFFDNGLGLNLDFRLLGSNSYDYNEGYSFEEIAADKNAAPFKFSKQFFAQLHYSLGIGFRIKRGSYLVPTMQLPIFGIYEWDKGNPRTYWYSSQYRPAIYRLKFIYLFDKPKNSSCESFGTEDDRKRNEEYMQNR
jgi:hypothetical protein